MNGYGAIGQGNNYRAFIDDPATSHATLYDIDLTSKAVTKTLVPYTYSSKFYLQ